MLSLSKIVVEKSGHTLQILMWLDVYVKMFINFTGKIKTVVSTKVLF